MNYTELQVLLQKSFSLNNRDTVIYNSDIGIHICSFDSDMQIDVGGSFNESNDIFYRSDNISDKNLHFSYPVFKPFGRKAENDVIILLHGLNERSWNKYLTWAYTLAENTGKSVVLFPIAFHMNRSPGMWTSPRYMNPYVTDRQKMLPDTRDLSFANVALSERLTSQPQRFFLSGYQAANDLLKLTDIIRSGNHPLFKKDAGIDFFSYSIGVLLSQVLLIANPGDRFNDSKFLFFCGGSVFEGMYGISKYILDSMAFSRILHFYGDELEDNPKNSGFFNDLLRNSALGKAFCSMTSFRRLKKINKNKFKEYSDRILTIALNRDKVIPADEIEKTMRGTQIEKWDFDYNYSHEVPFPLVQNNLRQIINSSFERLFLRASMHLA
ncbi:MAG: hypothetical protein JW894_10495 [Bacteroidales bacterium]|nr:hypothetical protein [Bacteroidales bacterium]